MKHEFICDYERTLARHDANSKGMNKTKRMLELIEC